MCVGFFLGIDLMNVGKRTSLFPQNSQPGSVQRAASGGLRLEPNFPDFLGLFNGDADPVDHRPRSPQVSFTTDLGDVASAGHNWSNAGVVGHYVPIAVIHGGYIFEKEIQGVLLFLHFADDTERLEEEERPLILKASSQRVGP